jgi:hypothetical protein
VTRDPSFTLIDEAAAFAAMSDPHAYRQYIAGVLPDPPASPFVPADPSAAAARDASPVATPDVSRVDGAVAARQLPAVPSWVQDSAKWVTLSRADRRALERHHRKVNGR